MTCQDTTVVDAPTTDVRPRQPDLLRKRILLAPTPETGWNWVYQYNWSGSNVESDIGIPGNTLTDEIEDISHIGSDFFIGINRNDGLSDTVNVFTE